MPGRRFERRPHPAEDIPRGDAADGRRTIVIETGDDELPLELPPSAERGVRQPRRGAPRPRAATTSCGRATSRSPTRARRRRSPWPRTLGRRRRVGGRRPASRLEQPEAVELEAPHTDGDRPRRRRGSAHREDRRPPGGVPRAAGAARRRPPRTMHERLGPRPERIAAWAFALGMLLILIAIATRTRSREPRGLSGCGPRSGLLTAPNRKRDPVRPLLRIRSCRPLLSGLDLHSVRRVIPAVGLPPPRIPIGRSPCPRPRSAASTSTTS